MLSDGLSDHYLILGFSNLFALLKLDLKTIAGLLAQLNLQGGREHKDTSNATDG